MEWVISSISFWHFGGDDILLIILQSRYNCHAVVRFSDSAQCIDGMLGGINLDDDEEEI